MKKNLKVALHLVHSDYILTRAQKLFNLCYEIDILRLFRWFVFVKNNNLIMIKDFLKIHVSYFRN